MFKKGEPRHPNAGRKPGQKNRVTIAAKAFYTSLCDDPEVQEKARKAMVKALDNGNLLPFLRASEFVVGKPKSEVDLNVDVGRRVMELLRQAAERAGQK